MFAGLVLPIQLQVLLKNGRPLSVTVGDSWNCHPYRDNTVTKSAPKLFGDAWGTLSLISPIVSGFHPSLCYSWDIAHLRFVGEPPSSHNPPFSDNPYPAKRPV